MERDAEGILQCPPHPRNVSESQQSGREEDERKGGREVEGGRGKGHSNMDAIWSVFRWKMWVKGGGTRQLTRHGGEVGVGWQCKEQKRVMLTLECRL